MDTPSSTALSYFDPGESPATTQSFFFAPDPAALPPRVRIASLASSREKPANEPVTTIVTPSSVRGTLASRSSAIRTPADRHFSTMWQCQSTVNHSVTASAMVRSDDRHALQRSRHAGVTLVGHPHPGRSPFLHNVAMPVDGEPLGHRIGDGQI